IPRQHERDGADCGAANGGRADSAEVGVLEVHIWLPCPMPWLWHQVQSGAREPLAGEATRVPPARLSRLQRLAEA
ncbi:unnamed protein product, partial [Symbiodinium necroappetens]